MAVTGRGRAGFARLTGAPASPPPPLAPGAIRLGLTLAALAGRGIVGERFGLLSFHLRFDLDVERVVLLEGFFRLRRGSRHLRRPPRPGGLPPMHPLAPLRHPTPPAPPRRGR